MKKIQVAALSALIACGAFLTSCGGGVSTNASIKNDVDSLSYAYGVSMYQQNAMQTLQQLQLYTDTAQMKSMHMMEIAGVTDEAKKKEVESKFKAKLDSTVRANDKNLNDFIRGMGEASKASESQYAYYLGTSMGMSMAKQKEQFVKYFYGDSADAKKSFNTDAFLSGMAAAAKNAKFPMEDPSAYIDSKAQLVQEKMKMKQAEEMKLQFADSIAKSDRFFAENKSKDGVVALDNGLQYKVVRQGNGPMPKASDMVKVHYKGTTLAGKVFDSSYDRKGPDGKVSPAEFNVSGVIPGWTQALQLMPVGSKWIVYIPYNLAYNEQQRGADITPFSSLIFEVELISIADEAAAQAAQIEQMKQMQQMQQMQQQMK